MCSLERRVARAGSEQSRRLRRWHSPETFKDAAIVILVTIVMMMIIVDVVDII